MMCRSLADLHASMVAVSDGPVPAAQAAGNVVPFRRPAGTLDPP
jgi:hypothetical protein